MIDQTFIHSIQFLPWTEIILTTLALYLMYWLARRPINLVMNLVNKERPESLRNDPLPPLYPNGWMPVVDSRLLKETLAQTFTICGQDIAVFRGSDGTVHAVDAYCPHMGANFGTGGTVVQHSNEDCLQCPFHGWLFRAKDGVCTSVPYAKDMKPPRGVAAKVWQCLEQNGFIYVWYHVDNQEPDYYPPVIPEIARQEVIYRGRTEFNLNCHHQEVPRNAADVGHFAVVHSASAIFGKNPSRNQKWSIADLFFVHTFSNATWSTGDPPYWYKANSYIETVINLFGIPLYKFSVKMSLIGPSVIHLRFNTLGIENIIVQTVTQISPSLTKIVHNGYSSAGLRGWLIGIISLSQFHTQVGRDVYIWHEKRFCLKPKLVKEEKSLVDFHKWFKQFYSENSVRRQTGSLKW